MFSLNLFRVMDAWCRGTVYSMTAYFVTLLFIHITVGGYNDSLMILFFPVSLFPPPFPSLLLSLSLPSYPLYLQSYPAVLSDTGPSPYASPMEGPGSVISTEITTNNGSV